jgi:Tfp pilus assembly protein PilN
MQLLEGFNPSEFMVNIGLALKQLPLENEMANVSIVDFNALPKAEKPTKKRSPANVLLPIVIVLGIGGIFYMYNLGRNAEARNEVLRSQLELTQGMIPQQQAVNVDLEEQIAEIEPQIEPIKAAADIYNTTFTTLEGERSQKSQSMTRIANLTPEDVALVYASNDEIKGYAAPIVEASIKYSGSMAKVVGRSRDIDAIFTYAKDLRGTGGFSDVVITSIERYEGETVKGYNFEFILVK